MPTVRTKNIMVGAGHLYVSMDDKRTALPTEPTATAPALPASMKTAFDAATTAWRYIGATNGGVEITFTPDIGEVEVDQLKDSALIFNTGQSVTVGTSLSEPTLANLMLSWGMRSVDLKDNGSTLNLAALPDEIVERSIAIVGNAPNTVGGVTELTAGKRERVYYGRRVLNVEGGAHTLSRTDATTLPITFRLLPDTDPTAVGQEYGVIKDRTIAA